MWILCARLRWQKLKSLLFRASHFILLQSHTHIHPICVHLFCFIQFIIFSWCLFRWVTRKKNTRLKMRSERVYLALECDVMVGHWSQHFWLWTERITISWERRIIHEPIGVWEWSFFSSCALQKGERNISSYDFVRLSLRIDLHTASIIHGKTQYSIGFRWTIHTITQCL